MFVAALIVAQLLMVPAPSSLCPPDRQCQLVHKQKGPLAIVAIDGEYVLAELKADAWHRLHVLGTWQEGTGYLSNLERLKISAKKFGARTVYEVRGDTVRFELETSDGIATGKKRLAMRRTTVTLCVAEPDARIACPATFDLRLVEDGQTLGQASYLIGKEGALTVTGEGLENPSELTLW